MQKEKKMKRISLKSAQEIILYNLLLHIIKDSNEHQWGKRRRWERDESIPATPAIG